MLTIVFELKKNNGQGQQLKEYAANESADSFSLCVYLTDIDECSENLHNCKQDTKCVNEDGSFHCDCYPGYIKVGDSCKGNINININFNSNMYSLSFQAF